MDEGTRFSDWRLLTTGWEISAEGYCDQPYVVVADDGVWVNVTTTGKGHEGQSGQHVVVRRSQDHGRTWGSPVALEPADGPEASWAVLLKVPSGRIYAFYNHNTDDVRSVKGDPAVFPDGLCRRVDSLGHFVFRFSDDNGCSWSRSRYEVPVRVMAIDRENADGGRLLYFWNVGKPFVLGMAGYVPLHKVGGFGEGFFTRSEGVLLRSDNILTESDPRRLRWETLPRGEVGIRAPAGGGPIAEEHSFVTLGDGSIYCVYRTIDGHPACTYSRDGGYTWEEPRYQRYADGRLMKHPRAANFVWRCGNGRFLYWFHNHGGRFIREHPARRAAAYRDRNPAWLCGGVEQEGPTGRVIVWSQPEIVLYDDDPYIRTSYPDLVEDGGQYYLTETQKQTARVHPLSRELVRGLLEQHCEHRVARADMLLEHTGGNPGEVSMPELPAFTRQDASPPYGTRSLRTGFSVEMWLAAEVGTRPASLLDARGAEGRGIAIRARADGAVEIQLSDGRTTNAWDSDPEVLTPEGPHHVVITVDAGPRIITFVVDGALCDGGDTRQFGWGRFSPHLRSAYGGPKAHVGAGVSLLRVYGRALRTSEAVGNWRAGIRDTGGRGLSVGGGGGAQETGG